MAKKQIGVVIYTYDRVDDAKINMEIIRRTWTTQKSLNNIPIVHVFNGNPDWWPEKYLEDDLIVVENRGHFSGCAYQIDVGIRHFQDNYANITHVVVMAADTWILNPKYVVNTVKSMDKEQKFLATCGWAVPVQRTNTWKDAAVDFFVIDLKFASSFDFFPLGYSEYAEKYGEVFGLLNIAILVETLLLLRFKQAVLRSIGYPPPSENLMDSIMREYIYLMKEREPVHLYQPTFLRRMNYPKLGMLGHHDPAQKQTDLKNYNSEKFGPNTMRFLQSTDLSYFNKGVIDWAYPKKRSKSNSK